MTEWLWELFVGTWKIIKAERDVLWTDLICLKIELQKQLLCHQFSSPGISSTRVDWLLLQERRLAVNTTPRQTIWVCLIMSLSHCYLVAKLCLSFCNPKDCVACQASLSMGFPRQEYWSGLPFLPPGDLPNPGIEFTSPVSPALAGGIFILKPPGQPHKLSHFTVFF